LTGLRLLKKSQLTMEFITKSLIARGHFTFHIHAINGVAVSVILRKVVWSHPTPQTKYVLYISNQYTDRTIFHHEYDIFNTETFSDILQKFRDLQYNGERLTLDQEPLPIIKELMDIPNIEYGYKECSVCYRGTIHKTDCKHPLCLQCEYKINENAINNDDDDDSPKCPICRKPI
jgi:hypothetical protein